jgi:hypothetical protein
MTKYVRLKREEYDDLCDKIRHLQTLTKRYDKRAGKIYDVIFELAEEIQGKRVEIGERINQLEVALNKAKGVVTKCESCLNKDCCDVYDPDT